MPANFEKMCRRTGAYSLPWLIRLFDKAGEVSLRFINDTQDREFGGNTYKASSFAYLPAPSVVGFSGGGSLEIAITENDDEQNQIIDLIEEHRIVCLDVVGCLIEDGTVSVIKEYHHSYGSVEWDGKKASFKFDRDDRLDMTFPALIFSHYNCRGI